MRHRTVRGTLTPFATTPTSPVRRGASSGGEVAPRHLRLVGRVHEPSRRYEDEGSVRESRGAVSLEGGSWWSAVLAVPAGAAAPAHVRLVRHAGPGDASARVDAELLVPAAELEDVVTLLAGVVAQARRDAVLPGEADRAR
jgi:hypothetical protein